MSGGVQAARAHGIRVVVAGGGFAGLYAASYLGRSELVDEGADLLLVDAKNHFTFTPLLAEVAGGALGREHVTFPYRVLGRKHGFRFRQDRIQGLDLEARELLTESARIPFDYLVLAMGAAPRFFGTEGAQEHSLSLTSIEDALAIRDQVVASFEAADRSDDADERRCLTSFVVAGAGPAGVEVASEIERLVCHVLPPYYPDLPPARVVLVQAAERILPGWDEGLAEAGIDALGERGIEVHLHTRIKRVAPRCVEAVGPGGATRWPARTLIWTAGTAPPEWVGRLPLTTERGALRVDAELRVEGAERVFAAGDVAWLVDARTGRPYPRVAPIAISQGVRAAGNIEAHALGWELEPYQAHHTGSIVSLGGGEALAELLGMRFRGRFAWWLYRGAYLFKLVGLQNKIRLLITLLLNHLFERDVTSTRGAPFPRTRSG